MIYEIRTYTIQPGSLGEVLKRVGDQYPKREKYSQMAAFWYTDIGPLSQIVHVWPYADAAERTRIRTQTVADKVWPPNIGEFIIDMESEIFNPLSFSPEMKPGSDGPIYEMRIYQIKPGQIGKLTQAWKTKIDKRMELSPLSAVLFSDSGRLNKLVHIWPYKSLQHRSEIREKAVAEGIWPPNSIEFIARQENKIMLPAPFSPMQ